MEAEREWVLAGSLLAALVFGLQALVVLIGYLCWQQEKFEYGGTKAWKDLRNKSEVPPGGKLVELTRGICHYRFDGEDNGKARPLVVLVHGFVGCHKDYDPLVKFLVSVAKRRVLRMDNFGRGWSSLPKHRTRIGPELYAGQLSELLFKINEIGPIDLVGYSMGGGIVSHFANTFGKEKVKSISYLAPAGLPQMEVLIRPSYQIFINILCQLPFGYPIMLGIARGMLRNGSNVSWKTENKDIHEWYKAYITERLKNEPALPHSFVQTIRTYPWASLHDAFLGVARHEIPTCAMWAERDELIPLECAAQLREIYSCTGQAPILEDHIVRDLNHIFVVESPEMVGRKLVEFWKKN